MADDDLLLALTGIELAAAAVQDAVVATGLLDATGNAIVTSFAEHHRAHAAAYAALLTEGATEPDADAADVLFGPVFGAVDGMSLLQGALAVEAHMAATALDACARLADQDVAALAARVAAVESRHQAVLGTALGAPLDGTTPAATTEGSLLDA